MRQGERVGRRSGDVRRARERRGARRRAEDQSARRRTSARRRRRGAPAARTARCPGGGARGPRATLRHRPSPSETSFAAASEARPCQMRASARACRAKGPEGSVAARGKSRSTCAGVVRRSASRHPATSGSPPASVRVSTSCGDGAPSSIQIRPAAATCQCSVASSSRFTAMSAATRPAICRPSRCAATRSSCSARREREVSGSTMSLRRWIARKPSSSRWSSTTSGSAGAMGGAEAMSLS